MPPAISTRPTPKTRMSEGMLEDKQLAERVNAWLPSNLRIVKEETTERKHRGHNRS